MHRASDPGSPAEVLAAVAGGLHGMLRAAPDTDGPGLDEAFSARSLLAVRRRIGSDDTAVVASVLARDVLSTVTSASVPLWSADRRVLDVAPSNLTVDVDGDRAVLGLRRAEVAVLPGDALAGEDGVTVIPDDAGLVELLERRWLRGACAAVVEVVRRAAPIGSRHLWGNVALAVVNTLTVTSHTTGRAADVDRATLLRHHELARTIELVDADDGFGGELTGAIRRTCCLLVKVPDAGQCGTCSLHPRTPRIDAVLTHHRAGRAEARRNA